MSEYAKSYGTVNTDAEREELLADKVAKRLSGQISGLADAAAQKAVSGLNLESVLEKVAGKLAENDDRARATAPTVDADKGKFKVTAPGYAEQFTSKRVSLASFEALKKRLLKGDEPATLRLQTQAAGGSKWVVEQELRLNGEQF